MRTRITLLVVGLGLSLLALGAAWHVSVHLAGRSPVPAEGQVMHVLVDAAVSLLVGGLAVAASLDRHLSHQRRAA